MWPTKFQWAVLLGLVMMAGWGIGECVQFVAHHVSIGWR